MATLTNVAALVAAGHRVVVLHGTGSSDFANADPDATILPLMHDAGAESACAPVLDRPMGHRVVRDLGAHIDRTAASLVVGVNQRDRAAAVTVARSRRIPVLLMAQNQHTFNGRFGLAHLKRWHYGRHVRRADLSVCASGAVRDELVHGFHVPADRTAVVWNGVETDRFVPGPNGFGDDGPTRLLCVGRLTPQKGYDLLLDALGQLDTQRDWTLDIAGGVAPDHRRDESERHAQALRDQTEALGLGQRVRFLGWRDDVAELLRNADGYVLPSRWEGWSLALGQALSAGLPIVASDCSGRPTDFTDGENGWIVRTGDVAALRQALESLVDMPAGARARARGLNRAVARRHYDSRTQGARFVELAERFLP